LKQTTERHEVSRGLSAIAELLVVICQVTELISEMTKIDHEGVDIITVLHYIT